MVRSMSIEALTLLVATLVLGVPAYADSLAGDAKFQKDRQAILAMAGEYRINFHFYETVAIEPGYELRQPYDSKATEFVEVIADTGNFISLQHILVLNDEESEGGPRVVKHWRQDWTYQDTSLNEYRGHRVWEHVTLDADEVKGTWSQAVYQVDDSPRYEAIGRWTHDADRSAWESKETWRPLPRREYTKRHDYHVLVARNRHTLTPAGWVHEQDNYKLVLDEQGNAVNVLVHELGLNTYDKVNDFDFSQGREYWNATQAYWQDVRNAWRKVLDEPGRVTIQSKLGDEFLHRDLFSLAGDVQKKGEYDAATVRPMIDKVLGRYVSQPVKSAEAASPASSQY